eukprot:scaffold135441_cov163-Phaeocystis_antarctica.AAC.1
MRSTPQAAPRDCRPLRRSQWTVRIGFPHELRRPAASQAQVSALAAAPRAHRSRHSLCHSSTN